MSSAQVRSLTAKSFTEYNSAPTVRRLQRSVARLLAFMGPIVLLILLWEILAQTQRINPQFFPAPTSIMRTIVTLAGPGRDYVLQAHIYDSVGRALLGFLIGGSLGLVIGILTGINRAVHDVLSPILALLIPIPAVAWTPIFLVSLGYGNKTMLSVLVLATVFPVIHNTAIGFRSVSTKYIWAVQSMGAGKRDILTRVLLPAALPSILAGCKLGMAHAWRTLVAVEMLAATTWGLGYMIFRAREFMATEVMYAGLVVLALLGFGIEHGLFGTLERRTVNKWFGGGG